MQLGVAGPHFGAVEVVAQQPQEERERRRARGSGCEGAPHLSENISDQGSEGGRRGLVRCDGAREIFLEGVLPAGDPIGRTKAFMAAIVADNEIFRRAGLYRTSELLRGIGRVNRRGKR